MTKKTKKLSLNRETLRALNPTEMGRAVGGGFTETCACPADTRVCPVNPIVVTTTDIISQTTLTGRPSLKFFSCPCG